MKKKVFGKCKLCGGEDVWLRNSHIISEFVYKASNVYDYNPNRKFANYSNGKRKSEQMGIRENLLCEDCEKILNHKYEEEFCNNIVPKMKSSNETIDADYKIVKPFLLSILWRASVSDEFKCVDLGPYENAIRDIILGETLPPKEHYSILVVKITEPLCAIVGFNKFKFRGRYCYYFHMLNHTFFIMVGGGNKYYKHGNPYRGGIGVRDDNTIYRLIMSKEDENITYNYLLQTVREFNAKK